MQESPWRHKNHFSFWINNWRFVSNGIGIAGCALLPGWVAGKLHRVFSVLTARATNASARGCVRRGQRFRTAKAISVAHGLGAVAVALRRPHPGGETAVEGAPADDAP